MEKVFGKTENEVLSVENKKTVKELAEHISVIKRLADELVESRKVANNIESERDKAVAYHVHVIPKIESIRNHIDEIELMVDDELWTLPKYREILFIC